METEKPTEVKVVEYERSLQWVGEMRCPNCDGLTPAWQSSGMSMCFPHFYCDSCSNVIHRSSEQALVWESKTQEKLDQIVAGLPSCPCGGRFGAGNDPKCGHCHMPMKHQDDAIKRLGDPHMIVVDGACVFSDESEPYQVRIVD